MNRFSFMMPAFLGLFSFGAAARADGVFVDQGNGVFVRDGNQFTRTWTPGTPGTAGYYRCGYFYPGRAGTAGYWTYYQLAATPPALKAPAYSADWKPQLLKIAAARDDYQAYLAGLRALGFQGQDPGYGGAPQGYGSSFNLGSFGANATTLYGYSYGSVKDLYGSSDLNTLYQQAARLTQNAQQLAGTANSDFSGLVGQEGSNRARVAEILAKAQAAKMALDAASAAPSTVIKGTGVQLVPTQAQKPVNPMQPADDAPADQAAIRQAWRQIAMARCAACHGDKDPKGAFRLSDYLGMPIEKRSAVLVRLRTADKDKMMPRTLDGKAGDPIPDAEYNLWAVVK